MKFAVMCAPKASCTTLSISNSSKARERELGNLSMPPLTNSSAVILYTLREIGAGATISSSIPLRPAPKIAASAK